ncbi:hypothetical protein LLK43_000395, partial [Acinetobacter baumannii]
SLRVIPFIFSPRFAFSKNQIRNKSLKNLDRSFEGITSRLLNLFSNSIYLNIALKISKRLRGTTCIAAERIWL